SFKKSEYWAYSSQEKVQMVKMADQAEVLTEWLENECIWYSNLTEAFEVWCYRSKVAKRRLSLLGDDHAMTNSI
ncbi:hypothetical protein HN873_066833, partial [Arachis hypogaea]